MIKQLVKWREQRGTLVVCLNTNGDIYKKNFGKELVQTSELDMTEVNGNFTGRKAGATFFRGKGPIDGVWATPDTVCLGSTNKLCLGQRLKHVNPLGMT